MRRSIAQCAFCIGLALTATSPLQADSYQFIKSGDPVAAATADSSSMASTGALETGTLSTPSPDYSLEARFRTWLEAVLNTKFSSFKQFGTFILLR